MKKIKQLKEELEHLQEDSDIRVLIPSSIHLLGGLLSPIQDITLYFDQKSGKQVYTIEIVDDYITEMEKKNLTLVTNIKKLKEKVEQLQDERELMVLLSTPHPLLGGQLAPIFDITPYFDQDTGQLRYAIEMVDYAREMEKKKST